MKKIQWLSALVLSACLIGCSGGSGSGGFVAAPQSSAVVVGMIESESELSVNGTVFDDQNATVVIDDNPSGADDLAIGMIVEIEGELGDDGTGRASKVTANDVINGPLETIVDANHLVVFGQSVRVDAGTHFDDSIPGGMSGLQVGDLLEVYGFVSGPGIVQATRIEIDSTFRHYEIEGIVEGLDSSARTFRFGALTIDFSAARLEGIGTDGPANGTYVEAEGVQLGTGGELLADEVHPRRLGRQDASELEVEGFVTQVTSIDRFTIGSQVVQVLPGARYSGGVPGDVIVGAKVEAEGRLVGGELQANRVKIGRSVRMEGNLANVSVGDRTFSLFNLPAATVTLDALTELKDQTGDDADSDVDTFLNALAVDDRIEVEGRITPDGIYATKVVRDDPDTGRPVRLRGPLDEAPSDMTTLTILGITVDTSNVDHFEDLDETVIDRATFFARLRPGVIVQVKGQATSVNHIDASGEDVELED